MLLLAFACHAARASAATWQPSPGHAQLPIWPAGKMPDALPATKPESVAADWAKVENVSEPTMTVYAPQGRNTGAAVVVFPGGGYQILAMDLEGTEICDWLVSRGITCVLLKYRVPDSGPTWKNDRRYYPKVQTALQDAQRTLGLVRQHAAQWQVDPHKIGVIGFSAGGHLVAAVSTHVDKRTYPAVDAADRLSSRPDFAIALYPGHLWLHEDEDRATRPQTDLRLRPDIRVRADTPPPSCCRPRTTPPTRWRNRWPTTSRCRRPAFRPSCISMRRAATPSACGRPGCRSGNGRCWWSDGCARLACWRRTEHGPASQRHA